MVSKKVKSLLADQDLRREADGAFLMQKSDVRAELNLSPEQTKRVEQAFALPKSSSPPSGRRFPGPSQEEKIKLIKALTKEQRRRLLQISIQFRSPMVFDEPEVIEALNLTYSQRQQIKMIQFEELGGFWPPGKKDGPKGPPNADMNAKARALQRILELLTPDQQELWRTLCGKPFNPSH
jgi:hypothetical protein